MNQGGRLWSLTCKGVFNCFESYEGGALVPPLFCVAFLGAGGGFQAQKNALNGAFGKKMVPQRRFELPTSPLPRECSTPELLRHIFSGLGWLTVRHQRRGALDTQGYRLWQDLFAKKVTKRDKSCISTG